MIELKNLEQFLGSLGDDVTWHAAEQAEVQQDLPAGQPVRQGHAVRQYPDQRLGGHRIGPDVLAEDPGHSAVRPEQAYCHRQRRGLACPVRPDQSEERAPRHRQVNVIHGDVVAELLEQPGELHRRRILLAAHGHPLGNRRHAPATN
jgi:hypothetical protein